MKKEIGFIKNIKKVWGSEKWIVNNDKYCAKYLCLQDRLFSSKHYHKEKDETFFIIKGKVLLEVYNNKNSWYADSAHELNVGDSFNLKPKVIHRFSSITRYATVLEISTHHDEKDTIRLK